MSFNPLPLLISAVGGYMLVKLKAFFILHPIRTAKLGIKALGGKGAFRSLSLALAGTLGVGNVLGVAVGIIVGGAGSVFWLLVSSIFAAALKYSEVVISSEGSKGEGGGILAALPKSFPRIGRHLKKLYALAALALALVMGAALQSGAAAECAAGTSNIPPWIIPALLTFSVTIAIAGGAEKIEKITAIIIPLTTVIYIIVALSVIVINVDRLPLVLSDIIKHAFSVKAAEGGLLGFLFGSAVKEGFCRGLLSNEAGAGTSSLAHTRCESGTPAARGVMGIIEVLFDTVILCTLTALAILTSVPDYSLYTEGIVLVMDAVSLSLGTHSCIVVLLCVFAFAYSTVICWYYYGRQAYFFAFGKRAGVFYFTVFLLFVFFGFRLGNLFLISLTDVLMLILTVITLLTLIKSSDRIKTLSELGGAIKPLNIKEI